MITKLLYIANVSVQLYFMTLVFFPRLHLWDVWAGFPIVTYCDFGVRQLGT